MNRPLSIGLIGCGRVAEQFYLPALLNLQEGRLVAVADPVPQRRVLFLPPFPGCRAFDSAKELLDNSSVEALIITTPAETHVAIATMALRAGVSALVEKPLGISLAGIDELQAAASSSPARLMVGFNRRFWKPLQLLQQTLRQQLDSQKASAQLTMTTNSQVWAPISDPLDDLSSHQLDLLRYVFGRKLLAVSAEWKTSREIRVRVRLEGNVVAECLAAQAGVSQESIRVECNQRQYLVRVDMGSERIYPATGAIRTLLDFGDGVKRRLRRRPAPLRGSFRYQISYFLHCLRSGAPAKPDLDDGIAVLRAVGAARESAAHGGIEIPV